MFIFHFVIQIIFKTTYFLVHFFKNVKWLLCRGIVFEVKGGIDTDMKGAHYRLVVKLLPYDIIPSECYIKVSSVISHFILIFTQNFLHKIVTFVSLLYSW